MVGEVIDILYYRCDVEDIPFCGKVAHSPEQPYRGIHRMGYNMFWLHGGSAAGVASKKKDGRFSRLVLRGKGRVPQDSNSASSKSADDLNG